MDQWDRLRKLPPSYTQQLHELYYSDRLPMEVRHYLSAWLEKQEWERAARELDLARVLFQGLLENLDIQHSRFVQEEAFLQKHNFRRHKYNFQKFEDDPCALASTIQYFLNKEKEILDEAEMTEEVKVLKVGDEPMDTSRQWDLERRMVHLRKEVQRMEHTVICLEEQQDEFDFKYQTHRMEAVTEDTAKKEQQKFLQQLINRLNHCRDSTLSDLRKLLKCTEELVYVLVKNELAEWQRKQQRACIGAPDSVGLDQLENWFTCVAVCLFQVRKFLSKLDELVGKVSYDNDPIKAEQPALQQKTDQLLRELLRSSLVVESQPCMPQGKGPLVLKTSVQFAVKTRLLVKFPELNHCMMVDVSIDRETPPIKGYRRFNLIGTQTKVLNMTESQNGGMVAHFQHLTLKEQKSRGANKTPSNISLSVMEELHIFCFHTVFEMNELSVELQAFSLPVVIISNSSQQQSAWASVLWFNMLSHQPTDVLFFTQTPGAPWPQLGEMLSWQFLSSTRRGLNEDQLEMIAQRLFGKRSNYDVCQMSWSKFTKENFPVTFWVWFDAILVMVKMFLEDLWRDGLIMGFVNKSKEKSLLKRKQRGTFLLRFSESVIGGITFSWVENTGTGQPNVKTVQPFTKDDLQQIPFQEIIRNFQILEADNVPESPLLYLYPKTPKDEAFGKYYAEKTGDYSPYIKYIKTKLVVISKELVGRNTLEVWSPPHFDDPEESDLLDPEADDPNGGLDPLQIPLDSSAGDPMLSDTVHPPLDDLLSYCNNPNMLDECEDVQEHQTLDNFSFQHWSCLQPPQTCAEIFQ